ncbi:MAG TPA: hypothetical protein VHR66_04845 [Gemmataceae bacterium]|nr:hypothetical protein [Gemmataceae bacterium]
MPQPARQTSAAVQYNTVLIIATADGVAAYSFTDRVDKGTEYKFRFRPSDGGKEQTGAGKVFERYKAIQGANANDVTYVYDGGDLDLKAGPIEIRWSRGGVDSGWIYFDPDKVQTHTAKAALFDTLDLKQFAK